MKKVLFWNDGRKASLQPGQPERRPTVDLVKTLREMTGLSLMTLKRIVDSAPAEIELSDRDFQQFAEVLTEWGCRWKEVAIPAPPPVTCWDLEVLKKDQEQEHLRAVIKNQSQRLTSLECDVAFLKQVIRNIASGKQGADIFSFEPVEDREAVFCDLLNATDGGTKRSVR
jgi:hypothetical protein